MYKKSEKDGDNVTCRCYPQKNDCSKSLCTINIFVKRKILQQKFPSWKMRKINFETSLQIFFFIPGIYDFREKGTERHTTVDLSSSKICLLTLHAWQCHGVSYLYHFNRNYLHPDCWCDKHLVMHLLITPKQFKRHKYFT